ncbi:MAG: cytidylate kinase-like family protein [Gammaproteobacteria bacterium]|nr:cytidylate kinase-like family protein [Gammaproteobacteria bacterium]
MAVITIGGQVGAGADELGDAVASQLGYDYVERLALRMVAKELRATTQAVWLKENHLCTWRERFGETLTRAFENMGRYGTAVEPTGYMMDDPFYEYELDRDMVRERPHEIPDDEHAQAMRLVNARLAETGALVLVKRAGCLTLRDPSNTLHVGLFAPREYRVVNLARQMAVGKSEASERLEARAGHRTKYFNRVAGTDPEDFSLYDVIIRVDRLDQQRAATQVIEAIPLSDFQFQERPTPVWSL